MKRLLFLFFISGILLSQFTNVKVNSYSSGITPEEVVIAINPTNTQMLAAGANLNRFYSSTDGGLNWTDNLLTSQYGVWGDPVVIYDAEGNLYYSHLSNPSIPGGYWIDRIVIQKSTNNGSSWIVDAGVGYNPPIKEQDKEWLAADYTNSSYRNNIYVAWTEFDNYGSTNTGDSTRILFSRSTDKGLNWCSPIRVSDKGGNCIDGDETVEGAVPAVGPNGEVYLSWSGPLGIMFDRSFDGGQTFGKDIFVTSQPGGWDFSVGGVNRCNGMPITACDISNSPYRGHVYIVWSDQRNGILNTDVFIIKSTNNGTTWGAPVKVNNDNTSTHQFFPWMTIDPITGVIYVVFYDRRNYSDVKTDVYLAESNDGGATFTNYKISESPFSPNASYFMGDYIGITAYNNKVHPIWTRLDDWELSVWTTTIDKTTDIGRLKTIEMIDEFKLYQNFPNPFNPSTEITYELPKDSYISLTIFDMLGNEVKKLVQEYQAAGSHSVTFNSVNLPSGVYIYKIQADNFKESKKCILLK